MLDDLEQISSLEARDYWAIARRRRWWFLLPLFLGWAVVWGVSWKLPLIYRSEAVILVERQSVPESFVTPNVAISVEQQLQTMTQVILSRTRLQQLIENLGLYGHNPAVINAVGLVERMREDIGVELITAPSPRRNRAGELTAFKITYSHVSPQMAQRVTSQLSSLFIEGNLHRRQEQAEITTDFLENQVEEAKQRLEGQEENLRKFRVRYLGQLPEQASSSLQILSGVQNRLQTTLAALSRAEQQKAYLVDQLAMYRSLQPDRVGPAVNQDLSRMRRELADLQARYSERHPDIIDMKEKIAKAERLKHEVETEIKTGNTQPETAVTDELRPRTDAELQSMSLALRVENEIRATELQIEDLQREVKELDQQIKVYQGRLNLIPLREQQLADLMRDYEQSRSYYESVLAKKMQSEMASDLEKRQQGEQFRILDPATLPTKPYSPDRIMLSWGGLLVGIMLGFGSAAGAELLDDRVHGEAELRRLFPSAVFTEIPPLPTVRERQMHGWLKGLEWLVGTALTAAVAAGIVFTYYQG